MIEFFAMGISGGIFGFIMGWFGRESHYHTQRANDAALEAKVRGWIREMQK